MDCVPRKSLSGVWLWSRGGEILSLPLSRLKIYRLTIPEERGEIAIRCFEPSQDIHQELFLHSEMEGTYSEPADVCAPPVISDSNMKIAGKFFPQFPGCSNC